MQGFMHEGMMKRWRSAMIAPPSCSPPLPSRLFPFRWMIFPQEPPVTELQTSGLTIGWAKLRRGTVLVLSVLPSWDFADAEYCPTFSAPALR